MNVTLSSPRAMPAEASVPAEKPLPGKHLAERTLPDRRTIVDRRALVAALAALAAESRDPTAERAAVLALLKETADKYGLPAVDPFRTGVGAIVDRLT